MGPLHTSPSKQKDLVGKVAVLIAAKRRGIKILWLTCWLIHPSKNAITSSLRHLQDRGWISSCGFRNFRFPNDFFAPPRCNTAPSIIFRLFPFSDTPHTPR